MRCSSPLLIALSVGAAAALFVPSSAVLADDSPKSDRSNPDPPLSKPVSAKSSDGTEKVPTANQKEEDVPETNLLDAMRQGLVAVDAKGRGDGRITMTIKNRTKRQLRVVLPPGLIAQSATGQFGGMGGMGGGMGGMGGGGMGGMGGGMGGMGGGMGGMGGGGMGGMGGMGRSTGTMPPSMGMMMLARMIMYFCGDPDSWDMRSLMIGMMGGMGGGMGGMGGMGGGMGGMGGMGGGMRSVPPTGLPFANLKPGQTRSLPTRVVSLTAPGEDQGLALPKEGEPLRILGDVAGANENPLAEKALKRLSAAKAPTSLSQLVMWKVSSDLDWDTIAQLSQTWANRHELTLARDFVDHLDALADGEAGKLRFEVTAKDADASAAAKDLIKMLQGNMVLGVIASDGLAERPEGPALACRINMTAREASVQVLGSDATGQNWVPFGKFTLPLALENGKPDIAKFADSLAGGILDRVVRAQVVKGSAQKEKGKTIYQVKIENASPLILNGLAFRGNDTKDGEAPRVLAGIALPPRRTMLVPTPDDVVRSLGLKKGIKVLALDLSGL